jgi:hypothetical protein
MRVARAEIGFPLGWARLWVNLDAVPRLLRGKPAAPVSAASYDAMRQAGRDRVQARERVERLTFAARRPL